MINVKTKKIGLSFLAIIIAIALSIAIFGGSYTASAAESVVEAQNDNKSRAADSYKIEDADLAEVALVYGANFNEANKLGMLEKFSETSSTYTATSSIKAIRQKTSSVEEENNVKVIAMDATNILSQDKVTLAYNVYDNKVFVISGKFKTSFETNHRKLGAPLTAQGKFELALDNKSAEEYTAQIFETGVLYLKNQADAAVTLSSGMPMKVSDSEYTIAPIIDDQDVMRANNEMKMVKVENIDGEWHPLKSARNVTKDDKITVYFNFLPGCIEAVYKEDWTMVSSMRYFGYNFVKSGTEYIREKMEVENFTYNDNLLWGGVEDNALKMYKVSQPAGTEDTLKAEFKKAYLDLVESGFMPGYRHGNIKVWDLIVLDFKYGDGTSGFEETGSGSRERMTNLVYSSVKNKVYPVYSQFWNIFKQDAGNGRKTLGAPISDVLKNHTIEGTTYKEVQFFEKAHIYKSNQNRYITIVGTTALDDEYKTFTNIPAPQLPGEYGALISTEVDGDKTYLNYANGAAIATMNKVGTAFTYQYFPGRNFDETKVAQLLPIANFLGSNGSKIKLDPSITSGKLFTDWNTVIKPMLVAKYQEYYEKGIFLGFLEGTGEFKDWNGAIGLQFIWGDSVAKPFGAERANVSFMSFSASISEYEAGATDCKMYIVYNRFLEGWGGKTFNEDGGIYKQVGRATSDPFQLAGSGIWFQYYQGIGGVKALMVSPTRDTVVYFTDGTTAEQFLKDQKDNLKETSKKDGGTGCGTIAPYFGGSNGTGLMIGLTIVLFVVGFVVLKRKTKNKIA